MYETLEAEEAIRALDVSLEKAKDIRETEKRDIYLELAQVQISKNWI